MPDATVWLAGGNPQRGTYEQHMEIYKPAYLFNSDGSLATRPTITSAPANIAWGTQFSVTTPDAANISLGRSHAAWFFHARVRHVGANGGTDFHRGNGNADLDRTAQRQYRSAGILHAVSAQQQWRALGGEIRVADELGESAAQPNLGVTEFGADGGRNAGDDHGHGLPGGSDSDDWRHGSDGSDGREQHLDYGHDACARGGRDKCRGQKHRYPDRNADQRVHLYESGADGERRFRRCQERRRAERR